MVVISTILQVLDSFRVHNGRACGFSRFFFGKFDSKPYIWGE